MECGHETAMFSGRAIYVIGSLQVGGESTWYIPECQGGVSSDKTRMWSERVVGRLLAQNVGVLAMIVGSRPLIFVCSDCGFKSAVVCEPVAHCLQAAASKDRLHGCGLGGVK